MLRIEIDVFSGRPNPVWIVTDETETKRLLGAVAEAKGVTAKPGAGFTGLGFREVRVHFMADDPSRPRGVPQLFAFASTASTDLKTSGALALRMVEAMPFSPKVQLVEHAITPLTPELRDGILESPGCPTLKQLLQLRSQLAYRHLCAARSGTRCPNPHHGL